MSDAQLTFLDAGRAGAVLPLPERPGAPASVHVFERRSIHAVNAALAAGRPLLVRGEPGTGKSQLARAAAEELGRVFVSRSVDSQTEGRDLCWTIDSVRRLGHAQLLGALPAADDAAEARRKAELDERGYVQPGPLWWAFAWTNAVKQAERAGAAKPPQSKKARPARGAVVLIDEIDKADASVPNALLEALGDGSFPTPWGEEVRFEERLPPLVVFTTNEERALPDPFLRRCFVLHLALPGGELQTEREAQALGDWLAERGAAHFPGLDADVLGRAAEVLVRARRDAAPGLFQPGQAEYLDLLRAVHRFVPEDESDRTARQLELLGEIAGFALHKDRRSPAK